MTDPAWTIASTLAWTGDYLKRHSIPDARLEAELLLAFVLNIPRLELMLRNDEIVESSLLARYRELILKRRERIPLAYLTGEQEFMDLRLAVDRHTLIPRPETELLVEEAIKRLSSVKDPVVLDIGTGSGCIGLSIARAKRDAVLYCSDISMEALRIAWVNAVRHGLAGRVRLSFGSLFEAFKGESLEDGVDLVISNPPYIPASELAGLEPELAHEPAGALDGGQDGLRYYEGMACRAARFIKPGGLLIFELNDTLSGSIVSLTVRHGFICEPVIKDYSGLDRILVSRKG